MTDTRWPGWPFPTTNAALRPAPAPTAGDVDMEPVDEAESPFCECDLELTQDEVNSGKCASCGKAVFA
jgi:hypothetical protein